MRRKLTSVAPYGISYREGCEMVGSRNLFDSMVDAGWIRELPGNVFSTAQVSKAFARIESGEDPKPTAKR
jgi:hypothetical protein